jgi:hypothetical protein
MPKSHYHHSHPSNAATPSRSMLLWVGSFALLVLTFAGIAYNVSMHRVEPTGPGLGHASERLRPRQQQPQAEFSSSSVAQATKSMSSLPALQIDTKSTTAPVSSTTTAVQPDNQQAAVRWPAHTGARTEPTAAPKTSSPLSSSSSSPSIALYIIFSTDCSEFQDWQTLLLFHSALVAGQTGTVVRIATGCDEAKQRELQTLYATLFPQASFVAHFTPAFDMKC